MSDRILMRKGKVVTVSCTVTCTTWCWVKVDLCHCCPPPHLFTIILKHHHMSNVFHRDLVLSHGSRTLWGSNCSNCFWAAVLELPSSRAAHSSLSAAASVWDADHFHQLMLPWWCFTWVWRELSHHYGSSCWGETWFSFVIDKSRLTDKIHSTQHSSTNRHYQLTSSNATLFLQTTVYALCLIFLSGFSQGHWTWDNIMTLSNPS